jgi:hypothetical protein
MKAGPLGIGWNVVTWVRVFAFHDIPAPEKGPHAMRTESYDRVEALFADQEMATAYVDRIRRRMPELSVHTRPEFVLSNDGGKTGYPLHPIKHVPQKSARLSHLRAR